MTTLSFKRCCVPKCKILHLNEKRIKKIFTQKLYFRAYWLNWCFFEKKNVENHFARDARDDRARSARCELKYQRFEILVKQRATRGREAPDAISISKIWGFWFKLRKSNRRFLKKVVGF